MNRKPAAVPAARNPLRQRSGGDPPAASAAPAVSAPDAAGSDGSESDASGSDATATAAVDVGAGANATASVESADDPGDVEAAWTVYVGAARQLDGVRRGAAAAAAEQARAVQAAREELSAVRQRLAPQRSRLHELGVPSMALVPSPPELTEATRSMVGGPTAVLAALRAARGWADSANALLAPRRLADWPPRVRNLLVYGPLALVVPLFQIVLYVAVGTGPASVAALLCGLPMPAVAFVAGWIGVGRLFEDHATGNRAEGHATGDRAASAAGTGAPERDPLATASQAIGAGAVSPAGGPGRAAPLGATPHLIADRTPDPTPDPTADSTPGGRLDRTPGWGAMVCLVPAVLTTAGIILAMLAG